MPRRLDEKTFRFVDYELYECGHRVTTGYPEEAMDIGAMYGDEGRKALEEFVERQKHLHRIGNCGNAASEVLSRAIALTKNQRKIFPNLPPCILQFYSDKGEIIYPKHEFYDWKE